VCQWRHCASIRRQIGEHEASEVDLSSPPTNSPGPCHLQLASLLRTPTQRSIRPRNRQAPPNGGLAVDRGYRTAIEQDIEVLNSLSLENCFSTCSTLSGSSPSACTTVPQSSSLPHPLSCEHLPTQISGISYSPSEMHGGSGTAVQSGGNHALSDHELCS